MKTKSLLRLYPLTLGLVALLLPVARAAEPTAPVGGALTLEASPTARVFALPALAPAVTADPQANALGHVSPVPDAAPAPSVTYGPNLVTNPGFETGDFTGYTVASSSGTVAVVRTEPHSGSYSAVFGNTHDQFDTISQTLTTVPGAAYTVSFWLESFNNGPTADDAFTAKFGGTTLLSEHNVGTIPYTQYSYTVVATGSSTMLSFAGYNAPNDDYLDDISVSQVPEPGTWAGGALLLGATGLALRPRRRRA